MEQGGEEALLPAVVEGREAAGSCDPKETPDTRIRFFYTFETGLKNQIFAVCVRLRHIYPCSYHSSCLRSKRRTRGSCDGEIWWIYVDLNIVHILHLYRMSSYVCNCPGNPN